MNPHHDSLRNAHSFDAYSPYHQRLPPPIREETVLAVFLDDDPENAVHDVTVAKPAEAVTSSDVADWLAAERRSRGIAALPKPLGVYFLIGANAENAKPVPWTRETLLEMMEFHRSLVRLHDTDIPIVIVQVLTDPENPHQPRAEYRQKYKAWKDAVVAHAIEWTEQFPQMQRVKQMQQRVRSIRMETPPLSAPPTEPPPTMTHFARPYGAPSTPNLYGWEEAGGANVERTKQHLLQTLYEEFGNQRGEPPEASKSKRVRQVRIVEGDGDDGKPQKIVNKGTRQGIIEIMRERGVEGMKYTDVHKELSRRGIEVSASSVNRLLNTAKTTDRSGEKKRLFEPRGNGIFVLNNI